MGSLIGFSGIYKDAEFPVQEGEEVLIGRDSAIAHIILSDERVSRKHCGICYEAENNRYYVMDYSTNGTYHENGEAFPPGVWMACEAGTLITIGRSGNSFVML